MEGIHGEYSESWVYWGNDDQRLWPQCLRSETQVRPLFSGRVYIGMIEIDEISPLVSFASVSNNQSRSQNIVSFDQFQSDLESQSLPQWVRNLNYMA